MARAIALAEGVRHRTAPNPAVGCVLVRDGAVVGEGATHPPGQAHAEAAALAAAGERAAGATAYVTLEPCRHQGRTPPCAPALADAGVVRVLYAHPDPHADAGGGAALLADRGVRVEGPPTVGDVFAAAVAQQLEGFLTVVRAGRPHVTLKLAQTADGALVAPDGARWITSPRARAAVHRWRAEVDAVLVGSGTVLADDPGLDVRLVPARAQPRPVVFDRRLRTPAAATVVARRALIVTTPTADPDARSALERAGATVDPVDAAPERWLQAAMARLAGHDIRSVLAEPGATLARALLDDDLADRVVVHVAGTAVDGRARWAVPPAPGRRFLPERVGGAGPDVVLHLRQAARPPSNLPAPTPEAV
jgi:diaminohydroxyphosphoribosylaminopyrimidine deaminase/5-amino-6-(5-phosphoribosylamino)uracil reductase